MIENLEFLPAWITRAGIPALSVMGFFWKGDEALSEDFKTWLSEKLSGLKLTVPDTSSIDLLGKIFDQIYGPRLFALSTFFRVSAISAVALVIAFFATKAWTHGGPPVGLLKGFIIWVFVLIMILVMNVLIDYLSVTKSRVLIVLMKGFHTKYRTILFIFFDLIGTSVIVFAYTGVFSPSPPETLFDVIRTVIDNAGTLLTIPPVFAFLLTTFMTLLLTILYLTSFKLLARTTHLIHWILPVKTLPVRSIGIVAGILLFCFLEILHALAG
jgi:hypothetical protein